MALVRRGYSALRAGPERMFCCIGQPVRVLWITGVLHRCAPGGEGCDDGRVRVLIPLPDRDFDVTEVAVPWRVLRDAGHQVVFATEQAGTFPAADSQLLTGVIFGQFGAAPEARVFYSDLTGATEFTCTAVWAGLDPAAFDGLLLPGGHAPGMRQYLGSPVLREQVARFWALGRPVGAICHGVLVLARTRDPATGRSVLAGRRTTWLPKYMERLAYLATAGRLLPDLSRLRPGRGRCSPGRPRRPVPARTAHPHRARHRGRRHRSIRRS
jgi:putative intracellular protease/amidase